MRLSSICICRRSLRSSAPSGSSSSSTAGRLTMARASATRCCCPPESWAGLRRANRAELDQLERVVDLLLDVLGAAPAQAERDVLEDVEVREQRVALEDRVDRPLVGLGEGHVLVADVDRARRSAPRARRPSAASSSCRSPTGRAARRTTPTGSSGTRSSTAMKSPNRLVTRSRRRSARRVAVPRAISCRAPSGRPPRTWSPRRGSAAEAP